DGTEAQHEILELPADFCAHLSGLLELLGRRQLAAVLAHVATAWYSMRASRLRTLLVDPRGRAGMSDRLGERAALPPHRWPPRPRVPPQHAGSVVRLVVATDASVPHPAGKAQ